MVGEGSQYVECFWMPQFAISDSKAKEVRRVTDFSHNMKKGLYMAEDIFFANNEYIPNGLQISPPGEDDIVFMESLIVGFVHQTVEDSLTGLPIYAKLIDKD